MDSIAPVVIERWMNGVDLREEPVNVESGELIEKINSCMMEGDSSQVDYYFLPPPHTHTRVIPL